VFNLDGGEAQQRRSSISDAAALAVAFRAVETSWTATTVVTENPWRLGN